MKKATTKTVQITKPKLVKCCASQEFKANMITFTKPNPPPPGMPPWFKVWSETVYQAQQPAWFKTWSEEVYEKRQPQWFKTWTETVLEPRLDKMDARMDKHWGVGK